MFSLLIWGMSGASSGACLGQHLGHIVNNGQQSAVLHASVMQFLIKMVLCNKHFLSAKLNVLNLSSSNMFVFPTWRRTLFKITFSEFGAFGRLCLFLVTNLCLKLISVPFNSPPILPQTNVCDAATEFLVISFFLFQKKLSKRKISSSGHLILLERLVMA